MSRSAKSRGMCDSVVLRKSQVVAQELQTSSTPLDRLETGGM